jgi:hypothetical protein
MRLLIKMLGIGLMVAAGIYYDRRRLRIAGRLDAGFSGGQDARLSENRGAARKAEVVTDAAIVGISDVDPQPLATMGEGVDPDAVDEAHRSVKEQRERLPVSGKNVP